MDEDAPTAQSTGGGAATGNGPATDADPTTEDGAADEAGRQAGPVTECTFTFTGDVNALLDRLGEYAILDLDVEEAPLEEVFMRYYGDSPDENGGQDGDSDGTGDSDRPGGDATDA